MVASAQSSRFDGLSEQFRPFSMEDFHQTLFSQITRAETEKIRAESNIAVMPHMDPFPWLATTCLLTRMRRERRSYSVLAAFNRRHAF